MTAQKSVLQLNVQKQRIRKKAWLTVSRFSGVTSIGMDDKTGKMTVIGEVDIPKLVKKLRKICNAEIVTVEAVKPPEKKHVPQKKEKPDPHKPPESVPVPDPLKPPETVPVPYPFECYYYSDPCWELYLNCEVVDEEPNSICAIL